MSEQEKRRYHSLEYMRRLQTSALSTHVENLTSPEDAAAPDGGISRRELLGRISKASAALAIGATGCERKPRRVIVSRAEGPEYQQPGKALHYASTFTEGPFPYGLNIKTVDGRPIKIDGNPDHPINGGVSNAQVQAWILSLYDPDRLQSPMRGEETASWAKADAAIVEVLKSAASVVVMTRSTLGPSERAMLEEFLRRFPRARHFVHESAHDAPRRAAWRKIYGVEGEWLPRFDAAEIIVSVDADFLGVDGPSLEHTRQFVQARAVNDADPAATAMCRLYAVESAMTLTGSNADHRLRLRPSAMAAFLRALRAALRGDAMRLRRLAEEHGLDERVADAIVDDLRRHRGGALVVAGGHLPENVHAAAAFLNHDLDAPGNTLEWNPQPATLPVSAPSEVAAVLSQGVDALILLGVNPVYDWPGGGFEALLSKAALSVGHDVYRTETLAACSWALPSNHGLESWNDAAPRAGLRSWCQPMIAPLFDTRQEAESLLRWTQILADPDDTIRHFGDWHDYLKHQVAQTFADVSWETCLRTGVLRTDTHTALPDFDATAAEALEQQETVAGSFEAVILPHYAVHDGRFANNAWLQELPDPISKMVWDNAAAISPKTAAALGVREGDMLRIAANGTELRVPALIVPGTMDQVAVLTLGHGRSAGGEVVLAAGGVNVAPLLGRDNPHAPRTLLRVEVSKDSGRRRLVRTQQAFALHGRPIVIDGTLAEFQADPAFVEHKRHLPREADLYAPFDYSKGHKWEMAINLNACTGCNACMIACQAENNIAVVGREECDRGRDMHWIRVDRYLTGDPENPAAHHQPMLCQHCDNAPCENVCPVNATTHSPEGLNEMAYNRCVGTRYCSNNCPYKVRRFNFRAYQDKMLRDPVQELAHNPQVTVRDVGVMEKCTFCVQRINAAKFAARNRGENVKDGAVRTACQEACPAQAIVFGDANDPESLVAKLKRSGRRFRVLEELNVKPNVNYLARIRNPHPGVGDAAESAHAKDSKDKVDMVYAQAPVRPDPINVAAPVNSVHSVHFVHPNNEGQSA